MPEEGSGIYVSHTITKVLVTENSLVGRNISNGWYITIKVGVEQKNTKQARKRAKFVEKWEYRSYKK